MIVDIQVHTHVQFSFHPHTKCQGDHECGGPQCRSLQTVAGKSEPPRGKWGGPGSGPQNASDAIVLNAYIVRKRRREGAASEDGRQTDTGARFPVLHMHPEGTEC